MAKEQKVYMPLMIGDWLKGTRGMKAEVRGVYINLLLYQWDNGYIPSDMETLSLIDPEVGKVWVFIKDKFIKAGPGRLKNLKNEEVKNFWAKQGNNGKLGGRPKGSTSKSKFISQDKIDWEEMLIFFDNSCVCCGYKFPEGDRPTKDHIYPRILGGGDEISNLQPLCRQCNSSKQADHATDYRIKFFSKIPEELRVKWFQQNPNKTQTKPKQNLHNDIDLDNDIVLKNKKEYETFEVEFADYERWTEDAITGNDPLFTNMLRKLKVQPNGHLPELARSHLALLATYPNKKPPDQHRFRIALINHIEEKVKPKNGTHSNTTAIIATGKHPGKL